MRGCEKNLLNWRQDVFGIDPKLTSPSPTSIICLVREIEYNLRGRVKFPTGGQSPRAQRCVGSGGNPEPTA